MKITDKEITEAKSKIDDAVNVIQKEVPSLPEEVEECINAYIERVKAESIRQNGDTPMATMALPMYKQMMRTGAFIALAYIKDKKGD